MSRSLNWGILGAGNIAKALAKGLASSKTGKLLAVGSRDEAKAEAFAKEFGATRSYGSYEALLADKEVEAVYIATPHPFHAEWAIKAAAAKKHLLSRNRSVSISPKRWRSFRPHAKTMFSLWKRICIAVIPRRTSSSSFFARRGSAKSE
jgi:saccharopine dehydrogenase-like NADP-dependent oxidoreductase